MAKILHGQKHRENKGAKKMAKIQYGEKPDIFKRAQPLAEVEMAEVECPGPPCVGPPPLDRPKISLFFSLTQELQMRTFQGPSGSKNKITRKDNQRETKWKNKTRNVGSPIFSGFGPDLRGPTFRPPTMRTPDPNWIGQN